MSSSIPEYWSEEWLRTEYIEKNRSRQDIADSQGVSQTTINNWLDKYNIKKISGDELYRDEGWLRENYINKGRSMIRLAELEDCSTATILRHMKEYDIPRRDPNEYRR